MTGKEPRKTSKVEWRVGTRLMLSENHNGTIDIDDHYNLDKERVQSMIDTLTAYLIDCGVRNNN